MKQMATACLSCVPGEREGGPRERKGKKKSETTKKSNMKKRKRLTYVITKGQEQGQEEEQEDIRHDHKAEEDQGTIRSTRRR